MSLEMYYARMELNENHSCLISANEIENFDKYLKLAREGDRNITIDLDTDEKCKPIIVAGKVLLQSTSRGNQTLKTIKASKNCALINIEEDFDENLAHQIHASAYLDIILDKTHADNAGGVPFWALMQTLETFQDHRPLTLFPCTGGLVWEDLVNRPYLLACRRVIPTGKTPTVRTWKKYIDTTDLSAFHLAEFVNID